jgi:hypothetical protein
MATLTLLKEKGIYSYYDFTIPRAALRLDELQSDNVMAIARTDNGPVVAYLISAAWYTGQLALISSNQGTAPSVSITTRADDYLGGNVSTLVNLVNGTPEVASEQPWFNNAGTTYSAYKMFGFVRTAQFWEDPDKAKLEALNQEGGNYDPKVAVDGGPNVPNVQGTPDNMSIGGTILGYLISPALYAILAAA